MKKLFYTLSIVSIMLIVSCGNEKTDTEKVADEMTEILEDLEINSDKTIDCDEYLDNYESWMDDYLDLLEDYMKNPMDASISQKYMTLAQEATNWYTNWGTFYACAAKEKYQKRFDEISEKAEKKMEELGIE